MCAHRGSSPGLGYVHERGQHHPVSRCTNCGAFVMWKDGKYESVPWWWSRA